MHETRVVFTKFCIEKGYFEFTCSIYGGENIVKEDTIFFRFNTPVIPSNELIAIACSTLCGTKYSEIEYDLPLYRKTIQEIEEFTKAKIITAWQIGLLKKTSANIKRICTKQKKTRTSAILNFSGGFDSLATLALVPGNTKLVSMDFGGWFEREKEFFKEFDTCIVTTNFRQLKYDRNSWTFMGVGSILLSDYYGAKYNIFGTIMEAARSQIRVKPSGVDTLKTYPFSAAGMKDTRYSNGLTEIGTVLLMCHYYPTLLNRSLQSLAAKNSEKRYRKQVLSQIVFRKFNYDIEIDLIPPPTIEKIPFGSNLATDFLSLYELKHVGLEVVNHTMSDIPQEAIQMAESMGLTFYERIHPAFIQTIPKRYRNTYLNKLKVAGVVPYTKLDYEELEIVSKYLDTNA